MQKKTKRRHCHARWPILLIGLATITFSTVVVLLTAPRIGRNIALGWMEVATILWRDRAIRVQPTAREFISGVLTHQSADFAWACLFFGLGARWTQRLRPAALLRLAPVWAVVTSAVEYFVILPWLQPLIGTDADTLLDRRRCASRIRSRVPAPPLSRVGFFGKHLNR